MKWWAQVAVSFSLVLATSSALAWHQVAQTTVFADHSPFQQIMLRPIPGKPTTTHLRLQILNPSGARLQRVELISDRGLFPLFALQGDYRYGMERLTAHPAAQGRTLRLELQSLRRGEPVTVSVWAH
ncbi:hypothetical protein [Bdellovibrio bacteriovorus]|uniref:hypothetical protein n=1 Tax=Bdellovibrio bacteriovorus TaxID=959 RepID=UPI0035A65988